MSDLVPAGRSPVAARVALADDAPTLEELFLFAREAELRVQSLRMVIEEHTMTARGEEVVNHEVLLRHPDQALVTSRRSDDPLSRDYDVWLSDGETATAYDAARKFGVTSNATVEETECMSGLILQGLKKPDECPHFGKRCTPENPMGATMVSNEGACAAYFRYRS